MKQIYLLKDYDRANLINIAKRINDQHKTLHFHDCIEISILMQGSGIHFINGTEFPYKKNSMSLLSFNDYHAIYNLSKQKFN